MEQIGGYAHKLTTSLSYEDAIDKVTALLKEEGFGILTEIDVKATLKKKIDVDYKPFKILGACNPPFAHKALETEHLMGVLMPCNVVVWDEGDHRVVAAMDVRVAGQLVPGMSELVEQINEKMTRALKGMEE